MKLAICNLWRRPLLPLLLALFLAGGVCCLTLFEETIEQNRRTIDELYDGMRLTYRVLPGVNSSGGDLGMLYYAGRDIGELPEVSTAYGILSAHYNLYEPRAVTDLSMAYGTANPDWFAGEKDLIITYGEGFSGESFRTGTEKWTVKTFTSEEEDVAVPCLMEASLMEQLEIAPGERFSITGCQGGTADDSSAPVIPMVLAGSFVGSTVEPMSLVVPEQLFSSSQGGLLYTANLQRTYIYYSAFCFDLNPEYNRSCEEVEARLNELLATKGSYLLYGNTRELTSAVRPLEQRGELQEKLVLPLQAAFCVICVLAGLLYSLSLRHEIFLRLLWGERRGAVLAKSFCCLCLPAAMGSAVGLGAALLLPGSLNRMAELGIFLAVCCVCSIAAAMVPAVRTCWSNLINLYQEREE